MFFFAHTGITLAVAEVARVAFPSRNKRAEVGAVHQEAASPPAITVKPSASTPERIVAGLRAAGPAWAGLTFYVVLLLGSLLPDIIDKPIGLILMGGLLDSGRTVAHTAVFALLVLLAGLLLLWRRRTILGIVLFYGVAMHFILDEMWRLPNVLWWPAYGWNFPRSHPSSISNWFAGWLNELTSPHFYVPELIGLLILGWFALRLILLRRGSSRLAR